MHLARRFAFIVIGLITVLLNIYPAYLSNYIMHQWRKSVTPFLFGSSSTDFPTETVLSIYSQVAEEKIDSEVENHVSVLDPLESSTVDFISSTDDEGKVEDELFETEQSNEELTQSPSEAEDIQAEDENNTPTRVRKLWKRFPNGFGKKPSKKASKKIPMDDEMVILPSLEVKPFSGKYRLIFFTTVELFNKKNPPQRITNTFRMFELFQRYYNFRAVVYTNSPVVISLCSRLGIYTEGNYEVNAYNMPLIRYMYNRTMHLVSSDYYGYINSDIIMTPNIFETLDATEQLVKEGKVNQNHEIASIVWDIFRLGVINTTSLSAYENYLGNKMQFLKEQRDYRSADYFIFSETVDVSKMADAVIGRMRIDNYLLSYISQQGGSLVDVTRRVIGIHQGLDGYKEHTRSGKQQSDLDWNFQWASDIQKMKGALMYAQVQLPATPYTAKIFERSRERSNVVKLRKMSKEKLAKLKINLPY